VTSQRSCGKPGRKYLANWKKWRHSPRVVASEAAVDMAVEGVAEEEEGSVVEVVVVDTVKR
jgi:hypothetical protein